MGIRNIGMLGIDKFWPDGGPVVSVGCKIALTGDMSVKGWNTITEEFCSVVAVVVVVVVVIV